MKQKQLWENFFYINFWAIGFFLQKNVIGTLKANEASDAVK